MHMLIFHFKAVRADSSIDFRRGTIKNHSKNDVKMKGQRGGQRRGPMGRYFYYFKGGMGTESLSEHSNPTSGWHGAQRKEARILLHRVMWVILPIVAEHHLCTSWMYVPPGFYPWTRHDPPRGAPPFWPHFFIKIKKKQYFEIYLETICIFLIRKTYEDSTSQGVCRWSVALVSEIL